MHISRLIIVLLVFAAFSACKTASNLFSSSTPHEKYNSKITNAGLHTTQLGMQWQRAATNALSKPILVSLPYKERFYFAANEPTAVSYKFSARQGERVVVKWERIQNGSGLLFAELFNADEKPSLLIAADTLVNNLSYTLKRPGQFILRMQPELLQSMDITVELVAESSLAFPVPAAANPRTQSFWGADRDGGARRHEGIDIFAPHRTPVIAAADGIAERVGENELGGKVVFVRTEQGNLYYAHLDEQLVSGGQRIRVGDTLGLMGNTGNARGGASHLHFGIYSWGGAVDPYPFVRKDRKPPSEINIDANALNTYASAQKAIDAYTVSDSLKIRLNAEEPLEIMALRNNTVRARTITDTMVWVNYNMLRKSSMPRKITQDNTLAYENPDVNSPVMFTVENNSNVNVIGKKDKWQLIENNKGRGWILSGR